MKIKLFLFVSLFTFSANLFAAIQTQTITYEVDGVTLTGFVAWDDAIKGKRPGILVVHEWWGHNDYVRKRAEDLAKLGYVGFALDMYGDNKLAEHPADAGKFMTEVVSNFDVMQTRFAAAKNELAKLEQVDAGKIAAIGYCFGGAVVLNMARASDDLAAVVSFHGSLGAVIPAREKINTPILVLNGADDVMVSAESIAAFNDEMTRAQASYQFINYPGAKHGFSNPAASDIGKKFEIPLEYNKSVDEKSWNAMKKFLKEKLK
jgi:dienelactone hydrolase